MLNLISLILGLFGFTYITMLNILSLIILLFNNQQQNKTNPQKSRK